MSKRISDAELVEQVYRDLADSPVEVKMIMLWDALYLLERERAVEDNDIRHFIRFAERMMMEQPSSAAVEITREFGRHAPKVRKATESVAAEIEFAVRRDLRTEIKRLSSEARDAIAARATARIHQEDEGEQGLPSGLRGRRRVGHH